MKLFEFFIYFDNPLKIYFGGKDNYDCLEKFLQLFSLCMTKDNDFSHRKKLIENHKDLLVKILKISIYTARICCYYHAFSYETYSSHKSIDSILKVLLSIENNNNNILLEHLRYIKINYAKFLSEKYAKNVCIVHLDKMVEIL